MYSSQQDWDDENLGQAGNPDDMGSPEVISMLEQAERENYE